MSEPEPSVLVEEIGAVRRLTLNRPRSHNPLTPRCIRELLGAVDEAQRAADVRVIVIRAKGPSFSSGYGILPDDVEPGETDARPGIEGDVAAMLSLSAGWAGVWECRIPVIAQVHGRCLAGGTDLALHCDIIVAATDARFGFPPVRSMGVPPTNMWLYHLGPQWTKRLLFTGDTVTGVEAAAIGLVQAAVPQTELDGYALSLAQRIALDGRRSAGCQQAGDQPGDRAHGPVAAAGVRRPQRRRGSPVPARSGLRCPCRRGRPGPSRARARRAL